MADVVFDTVIIQGVIDSSVENDLPFQINFHGVELETAVGLCEDISGHSHKETRINQQPSCFVVSVQSGRGEVTFFCPKGGL